MEQCEIAAGDQHRNQWLNFNLSTSIPHKVPMGENLKIEWTPTDRVSMEPLRVTLTHDHELQIQWQEYRWVNELELLGQLYLNQELVYLTERSCFANPDPQRPYTLYKREKQKSVCVTNLVAALEDPQAAQLSLMQSSHHGFDIHFLTNGNYCQFRIDVNTREAEIYTSDTQAFPDLVVNEYTHGLHYGPPDEELVARANAALDPSQLQSAFSVSFQKTPDNAPPKEEAPEVARWNSTGRIPPFDSSGRPRVSTQQAHIKAPFNDTRKVTNPLLAVREQPLE